MSQHQADTLSSKIGSAASAGVAVIVATSGRPDIIASLVKQLGEQTQPPAHIFIIGAKEADFAQLDRSQPGLTVSIGRPGSTRQRNDGLAQAGAQFSYIVFFDDDFVPSRFWLERAVKIFEANADVVGLTGAIMADGTRTAGIPLHEAKASVTERDAHPTERALLQEKFPYGGNVGCNMAYRYSAIHDIIFDESLPLYAFHEDSDFRGRAERRGIFARSKDLWGVHLGHKQGRGNSVALGYSQIVNATYLAKKGTVSASFLAKIAIKNVIANAVRSLRPEPFCDRRGRLRGNMLALKDLLRGRITPARIQEL